MEMGVKAKEDRIAWDKHSILYIGILQEVSKILQFQNTSSRGQRYHDNLLQQGKVSTASLQGAMGYLQSSWLA